MVSIQGFFIEEVSKLYQDTYYMERVINLARKGEGQTSPNPQVGALVVKDDSIIGQGYHKKAGGPHAEVIALQEAGPQSFQATLYVNLEPCVHYGQTPPCTDMIIKMGIMRVVVAMEDPNPLVKGKGLLALKEAGIEVKCGVMEEEAYKLNQIFIKYITTKRPFVYLKGAMTFDGKIATLEGDGKWISSKASREYVHYLRNQIDAILVGRGTVEKDDPALTTRLPGRRGKDGARIILDSHLQLSSHHRIFTVDSKSPTILATISKDQKRIASFQNAGVLILPLREKRGRVDLFDLLEELGKREITSLLVEGGSEVNAAFLEEGLVDTMLLFLAPKILLGREAVPLTGGRGFSRVKEAIQIRHYEWRKIGEDLLITADLQKRDG